ncbi:hypothetical protein LX90_004954 [Lentzea flava]|nr:hypothetical protein [Lentzea flava]
MVARSCGVALACALLVLLGGCGNNRSAPSPQTTRVPTDTAKWARTYCTEYGLFVSARQDPKLRDTSDPKAAKAAALKLTFTAMNSLHDIADATEDLGVLTPEAKDTHERLVGSLRAVADGYAASAGPIEGLAADAGFGAAFRDVLAEQVGSSEDDVEELFEALGREPAYGRALDQDRVCAGVRYMQGK